MSLKYDKPATETIQLKTETEHLLFRRYSEEQHERKKLQCLVEDLRNQIGILQEQLKCLVESNSSKPSTSSAMETSSRAVQYSTDEEDLARETEWIRVKSRKKRKLNTSPIQDCSLDEENKAKKITKKDPLPPPIIVDGIKDYQTFFDFLSKNQAAETFNVKIMNGDTVKINAINDESYRTITKGLSNNNCLWHSYENKQERPIRVMVKKLPSTCKPERIVEDLKAKGFNILEAVNKLSWKSKEALNMFMLTFENNEDINKIFNIKTILGCKVDMESIRTTKLVPQCKRCQAYGHTQKYCSKEPRCVKCTRKHLTKDCTKASAEKPKCVHCGAPHPANYRGCVVAKEIQLIRNRKLKNLNTAPQQKASEERKNTATQKRIAKPIDKNTSYAQVVETDSTVAPRRDVSATQNEKKLDDILRLISSFDERLKRIENSATHATTTSKK